jgi:tRNA threonylcarbamoyladenosine biosynthesis protein TsaE
LIHLRSDSSQQTIKLAQKIGQVIPAGTVLALKGDLGAGKTTFAQGLAQGLGVREQVTSPTFVFWQQYQGRLPFYHLDAYRLSPGEGEEIGLEECFEDFAVTLVEWPEQIAELLPENVIRIEIKHGYDEKRQWRDFYFLLEPQQAPWLEETICTF